MGEITLVEKLRSIAGPHSIVADEAADEIERLREPLWTCDECGFTYDKVHSDEKGHHSCPCCNEWELEQRVKRLRAELKEISIQDGRGGEFGDEPMCESRLADEIEREDLAAAVSRCCQIARAALGDGTGGGGDG